MTAETSITLIYPDSLGDTLDAVNAVLFENLSLSDDERAAAAAWIANRPGLPGSYAGMFAPTKYDYAFGALTFTGETIVSHAGAGHILSEEACYALSRLVVDSLEVREALKRALRGIFQRLDQAEVQGIFSGVHCCGMCTVALWRHFSASGVREDQRRLEHGLAALNRARDGKGRWRRFPYHYTLLALSEIDLPAAREEICYAAKGVESALRRLIKNEMDDDNKYSWRLRVLFQRVLEKC